MNISKTTATAFAVLSTILFATTAVLLHVYGQPDAKTTGWYLTSAAFSATLVAFAPVVRRVGQDAGADRAAIIGPIALVALAAAAASSGIRGEDYGFFPFVAVPANLAILVSLAVIGRRMHQRGASVPAAAGMPLLWIAALPLSQLGGMFVTATYVGYLAYTMASDTRSARLREIKPVAA